MEKIKKQEEAFSTMKDITVGIQQSSVLWPVVYLLYTFNIPKTEPKTQDYSGKAGDKIHPRGQSILLAYTDKDKHYKRVMVL